MAMIDVIGGNKKGNENLNTIVSIAILVFIILIIVRIYKAMQSGSKAVGSQIGNQVISVQTGIPAARIDFLKDVAIQANSGVYRLWGTNTVVWIVDDEVVQACNMVVSPAEAALLSQFYKQNTGSSLRRDVIESSYMIDSSRAKIQYKTSFT